MEQLYHCKGVGELGLLILSNTSLVKSGPSTLSNTLFCLLLEVRLSVLFTSWINLFVRRLWFLL